MLRHCDWFERSWIAYVTAELDTIADAVQKEANQLSIKELFTTKKLREKFVIGMGIHILSQTTGINLIFTFDGMIFENVLGKGIISVSYSIY